MSQFEKRILQEFAESTHGTLGCECEWNSRRYTAIRGLENQGLLKYHYFAEGFVYFLITTKGREAIQNQAA